MSWSVSVIETRNKIKGAVFFGLSFVARICLQTRPDKTIPPNIFPRVTRGKLLVGVAMPNIERNSTTRNINTGNSGDISLRNQSAINMITKIFRPSMLAMLRCIERNVLNSESGI